MPTLPTTPRPTNAARDDSWLLDENFSPALVQGSMRNLNISDSPVVDPLRTAASANSSSAANGITRVKKPIKSRPSWGSAPVLDATNSAKSMSKMRLLAGLDGNDENKPPVSRRGPTSGGAGRPRFSLFAKPGVPTNLVSKKAQQQSDPEDDDDDLTIASLPDSSIFASSSSAMDPEDAYIREALSGTRASSSTLFPSTVATPAAAVESKETTEQTARQLTELRRMNDVFESFERMLRSSAGQINAFANRVKETDDLLNIYIGLLRQTEKTQLLLQDQDWKGTSEDATAHALSVALAERETQRLREEALAREEEQRRAAEEEARREEEAERRRQEEQRRAAMGGVRGRGRAVSGSTRGTARGASAAATRGRAVSGRTASTTNSARSTTAPVSTRGAATATRGRTALATGRGTARPSAIPTRSTSGSSGLGGQYANVKSSGYGPK